MRQIGIMLVFMLCAAIADAQRFESHKVYLTNNGVGSRIIKVKPSTSFTIKKDNRMTWAKYQIGNGQVTITATANTTTNNRSCDFVLIDKAGNPVDTLQVIQAGTVSATTVRTASKLAGTTTTSQSRTATMRKSSTSSSRTSYGGQCAATTKKGRRCTRQASSGSIYCWQHK